MSSSEKDNLPLAMLSVLEQTPVCAKIVDRDLNLQYMSRAGVEGLGIEDISEFYGKPYPLEFYPQNFRTQMTASLRKAEETGEPGQMEGPVTDISGNVVWYQSTITPILTTEGAVDYFHVVSIDTSARHKAEAMLLEHQHKLQSLASELVIAEERERKRIALLLHDDVCQNLTYANLMIHMVAESENQKDQREHLGKADALLRKSMEDIRALSFDLSFDNLTESGLESAISHWLTDRVKVRPDIDVIFHDDGLTKPLSDTSKFILFRSVRELLNNTIKHSNASRIEVRVRREGEHVVLGVYDNGKGFNPERLAKLTSAEGLGLFSIRERMKHLHGEFEVNSSVGNGCEVILRAPLLKAS